MTSWSFQSHQTMRMCSSYRLKWGDKEEWFKAGRKSGWRGERMMSPLSTSSVARGPWHCSHLPHGTSCPGHTQTHTVHDRKSLYLYQFHQCLFAFTPIKPFLAASRHMLPLLNSWDADLPASVVQSHFQSVPPQRKSSLTPSSLRPSQKSSQCCRFYRESRAGQYTHGRAHVWIRMSGCRCCFPFVESHHWEQTEGCFYDVTGLRWDWK